MVRLLFFLVIFLLDTVVMAISAILVGIVFGPYSLTNSHILRMWSKIAVWAAGVRLEVLGKENINPGTSYVILANHQSQMDIPVAVSALPIPVRIISKKEVFRIPFLGWGMKAIGILKIDRSNSKGAIETLKHAENVIRENQLSILAFPEGTRSIDGKIQPFKKGAFVLAINTGFPLLPISISGTRKLLPKGQIRINPGKVKVVVHQPVPVEGYSFRERHQLVEQAHDIISKGFIKNYG